MNILEPALQALLSLPEFQEREDVMRAFRERMAPPLEEIDEATLAEVAAFFGDAEDNATDSPLHKRSRDSQA